MLKRRRGKSLYKNLSANDSNGTAERLVSERRYRAVGCSTVPSVSPAHLAFLAQCSSWGLRGPGFPILR